MKANLSTQEVSEGTCFEEFLNKMTFALMNRFDWLEGKIQIHQDDEELAQRLTNSQQRVAKSIMDCIALARDPRLGMYGGREEESDLAILLEKLLSAKIALSESK